MRQIVHGQETSSPQHSHGKGGAAHISEMKGGRKSDYRDSNTPHVYPSALTRLTALPHLWCLYNFSVAIMIVVWMYSSYSEYIHRGRINLGWRLLLLGFAKMDVVVGAWCWSLLMVLALYPALQIVFTINNRRHFSGVDTLWRLSYIVFQVILLARAIFIQTRDTLPLGSSILLQIETVRLMMKSHAFVTATSRGGSGEEKYLPPFLTYCFFLFAPTLDFRPTYSRSEGRNWRAVWTHLTEMASCLFFLSCLYEAFGVRHFSEIGKTHGAMRLSTVIHLLFETSLAATLFFVWSFYLIFHATQNFFAEVMCFADRRFYGEWWVQHNHWCLFTRLLSMIYNFLQAHIHPQLVEILRDRQITAAIVYLLPAILLQVIFSLFLKSFFPVILVVYAALGTLGTFIDQVWGNLFTWSTLVTANGVLWILLSTEYYARNNCPNLTQSSLDTFMWPAIWTCENNVITI